MDVKLQLDDDLYNSEYIKLKCKDKIYAQNLYAALCNNIFFKNGQEWSCSWRMSGGIVADIRNIYIEDWTKKEDYMDWYCSGIGNDTTNMLEGDVSEQIEKDLLQLGWSVQHE